MLRFLVLCGLVHLGTSFLFGGPSWNDLKITWGQNPFSSNYFVSMPRKAAQASSQGWTRISSCNMSDPWRGERYVKKGDFSTILLYDVQGYIAGIQTSIPKAQGYPTAALRPPFVEDGDRYTISAYFTDPKTICTTGRTAAAYADEGTGNGLWLQKTGVPEESVLIPSKEGNVDTNEWTKGKCFPTMGMHYWNQLTNDMDCAKNYPVFLLYNGNKLNGFGWALNTDLVSTRYEHPKSSQFSLFMQKVPFCLKNTPAVSTMHIYMTSTPLTNFC